jgi:hypothetical protein
MTKLPTPMHGPKVVLLVIVVLPSPDSGPKSWVSPGFNVTEPVVNEAENSGSLRLNPLNAPTKKSDSVVPLPVLGPVASGLLVSVDGAVDLPGDVEADAVERIATRRVELAAP